MAVEIIIQGGSFELDETANLVRKRLNDADKMRIDYQNGNLSGEGDQKYEPYHLLSFKQAGGGRVSINPEKVIAVADDGEGDE